MYRKLCVFVIGILIFSLVGCASSNDTLPIVTPSSEFNIADYDDFIAMHSIRATDEVRTLSELESISVNIVKGIIQNDSTIIYQYGPDGDEDIIHGDTVTTLEITEVYEGNLKVGDKIKLAEPYYDATFNGRRLFFYSDNYFPSTPGSEYVFFLPDRFHIEPLVGTYAPKDGSLGRYPVLDPTRMKSAEAYTNDELNLGTGDSTTYEAILSEVMDKYMK